MFLGAFGSSVSMASALYSSLSWCCTPIPKPSFKTPFSSSIYPLNTRGFSGISLHKSVPSSRTHAKFDKFQGQENLEPDPQLQTVEEEDQEEDDRWVWSFFLSFLIFRIDIWLILILFIQFLNLLIHCGSTTRWGALS